MTRFSDLFSALAKSSYQVVARIFCSLFIIKIIASLFGPSGITIHGQLTNLINLLTTIFNSISSPAIINLSSDQKDKNVLGVKNHRKIWSACLHISLLLLIIVVILNLIFAEDLNRFLFGINFNYIILKAFILTTSISVIFSSITISIINTFHGITLNNKIHISSFIIHLCVSLMLIFTYELQGLFISVFLFPIILALTTYIAIKNLFWFKLKNFLFKVDLESIKKITPYFYISIFTSILIPITQIIIRSSLIENLSYDEAGFWQATTKISDIYFSVVNVFIITYFIPKLSSNKNITSIFYFLIIIFFAQLFFVIFQEIFIKLLFTDAFIVIKNYIKLQFLSDLLRIFNLLFFYIMLRRKKFKWAIFVEISYYFLYLLIFLVLMNKAPNILNPWISSITSGILCITLTLLYFFKNDE